MKFSQGHTVEVISRSSYYGCTGTVVYVGNIEVICDIIKDGKTIHVEFNPGELRILPDATHLLCVYGAGIDFLYWNLTLTRGIDCVIDRAVEAGQFGDAKISFALRRDTYMRIRDLILSSKQFKQKFFIDEPVRASYPQGGPEFEAGESFDSDDISALVKHYKSDVVNMLRSNKTIVSVQNIAANIISAAARDKRFHNYSMWSITQASALFSAVEHAVTTVSTPISQTMIDDAGPGPVKTIAEQVNEWRKEDFGVRSVAESFSEAVKAASRFSDALKAANPLTYEHARRIERLALRQINEHRDSNGIKDRDAMCAFIKYVDSIKNS